MSSHVYLAFGNMGDQRVMKVGKANNVKRRQQQIGIKIDLAFECVDEIQAFVLETWLRTLLVRLGAVKIGYLIDWFIFDDEIYDYVKLSLISQREGRPKPKKFHVKRTLPIRDPLEEKLKWEWECQAMLREINILRETVNELKEQLAQLHEEIIALTRRLAEAETELRLYREGRLKPDDE